ncbi:M15 family metallopeptidase [Desulfovibrio mangrovi]|uniref:M15 family metallopeptidase n=1 Tax=Desulfovibrio mangrovi TaxID=2976983 RepID=UPI00224837B7|nr:M15 family metallopeptidase [Desulfovibrio mangrovi]UZP66604.1 M15 family metallopeptidase [Desulfovibrio mangrovi]
MLNRRHFLQHICGCTAALAVQSLLPAPVRAAAAISSSTLDGTALHLAPQAGAYDLHIRDYYDKMRHFDSPFEGDIILQGEHRDILYRTLQRIQRMVDTVGYANFSLLGFDDAVRLGRNYPKIGTFTKNELEFMECQFYADAAIYGFYGVKVITRLTERISQKNVIKVPYSGNYLFKGEPHDTWLAIQKTLGNTVVLTSGVRGVMKQFHLFLNKAVQNDANLSLASRSLAPPGYSFHGVSDFDVGQRDFGEYNFTDRFTETDVFARLAELGYLTLRYPRGNRLGVRFEPWHVKVNQA